SLWITYGSDCSDISDHSCVGKTTLASQSKIIRYLSKQLKVCVQTVAHEKSKKIAKGSTRNRIEKERPRESAERKCQQRLPRESANRKCQARIPSKIAKEGGDATLQAKCYSVRRAK